MFRLVLLLITLSALSLQAQTTDFFMPAEVNAKRVAPLAPGKLRQRLVTFNSNALLQALRSSDRVNLPLFEDSVFEVTTRELKEREGGYRVWKGIIDAEFYGAATLVFKDNQMSGHIQVDQQIFTIRQTENGQLAINEIYSDETSECAAAHQMHDREQPPGRAKAGNPAFKADSTDHLIKILVLFDDEFCHQIDTLLIQYEEQLNDGFAATYVQGYDRIRVQLTSECFGNWDHGFSIYGDKDALKYDSYVQDLRYAHQADLVTYITDHNYPKYGGYADIDGNFSIIEKKKMESHLLLLHEIGHNFGMDHDRRTLGSPNSTECNHGWGQDNGVITVMSYKKSFDNETLMPVYSQPNLVFGNACDSGIISADNRGQADKLAHKRATQYAADYLVTSLPYVAIKDTFLHGDTFDVDGNDGKDVAFFLSLDQTTDLVVAVNGLQSDGQVEIFDIWGTSMGLFSSPTALMQLTLPVGGYYVVVDDPKNYAHPFTLVITGDDSWQMPINSINVQAKGSSGVAYDPDWAWDTTNINKGAGGNKIYLGWTRSYESPITDITVIDAGTILNTYIVNQYKNAGWTVNPIDLNRGAGGNYMYFAYRHDGANPITDLAIETTDSSSPPSRPGWISINKDLNKNAGGKYVWLFYKQ